MEGIILDATGIDKAVLLRELVNLVWLTQEELRSWPLRDARAAIASRLRDEAGTEGKGRLHFAYMDGLPIDADLTGDRVDLVRYREKNFPDVPGEVLVLRLQEGIARYATRDAESGLVAREWVRDVGKTGRLTETPLEGSEVVASFIDPTDGGLVRVAGMVVRDNEGHLVVRTWSERAGRAEIRVPRDASVEVKGRPGR